MTIRNPLLERAASFRRRAEWMINGDDRDRILAMASEFEAEARQTTSPALVAL